jgi:hypothetical protein
VGFKPEWSTVSFLATVLVTLVRSLTSVASFVVLELVGGWKGFIATIILTLEGEIPLVSPHVCLQVTRCTVRSVAPVNFTPKTGSIFGTLFNICLGCVGVHVHISRTFHLKKKLKKSCTQGKNKIGD